MSAFADVVKAQRRRAPRSLLLRPEDFADDWERRPREPVAVGLRLIAAADENTARVEAAKLAAEAPDAETQLETYNDALMRWVVARGICDPNDVTQPSALLPMAEDEVRFAFTRGGIVRIFDEIERLQVESSALYPEATDDEIGELMGLLMTGENLEALEPKDRGRARRYLRFVLDYLREVKRLPDED